MQRKTVTIAGQQVELEYRICDGGCEKPFWVLPTSTQLRARGGCEIDCVRGQQSGGFRPLGEHRVRMAAHHAKWRHVLQLTPKYRQVIDLALRALKAAMEAGERISVKATVVDHGFGESDWGNVYHRLKSLAEGGDAECRRLLADMRALNDAAGGGKSAWRERLELIALSDADLAVIPSLPHPETPVPVITKAPIEAQERLMDLDDVRRGVELTPRLVSEIKPALAPPLSESAAVLFRIVDALRALPGLERRRVLGAVAVFYGIKGAFFMLEEPQSSEDAS